MTDRCAPFRQDIEATLARVKRIAEKQGVNRIALDEILGHLVTLADNKDCWSEDRFPSPGESEFQVRYLVSESIDKTYALYLNVMRPGKKIPPHNHTTWACIAAVEGEERNIVYERIDDQKELGVAKLQEVKEVSVAPGTGIALMADDVHSVDVQGTAVTRHLHLYGNSLETLSERIIFNVDAGTYNNMVITTKTTR